MRADVGKKLRVKVSFTDDDGNDEELTSDAYPASGTVEAAPNAAPSFTSPATFNAAENEIAVGTVAAADGDPGDSVTGYAIQGGADAARFTIVEASGVLTFASAPNFEAPADADTDNDYVVVVRATSGTGARLKTADQTITVTVTVNAAPTASASSVTTNEDTAYTFAAADFNFTDSDGDALASVTVVTLPTEGSLTLDGPAVRVGQSVPAADIGKLAFTPAANGHGDDYANFTFRVHDGTDESASAYVMTVNVTAMNDPATGAPTISGTAQVGQTLTAATTAIADVDGLTSPTYGYQWIQVDADGTSNPTDIVGAASGTYTQVRADVGKKLRVKVSFTDDDGNHEELTSAPTPTVLDPTVGICGRTEQVRDALVAKISGVSHCADVTAPDLAAITGTLLLNSENITALAAGDFDGLTGLSRLFLAFNALATLGEGVFDGLTSLSELYLENNQLTTLDDDVFEPLTALTGLYLQNNQLPTLPDGVFDGLTALTGLYLFNNALATLPDGVFDGLTSLMELSLIYNQLTTLDDDVFQPLTALTTLALRENPGAPFAPEAVALPDDGTVSNGGGTVTLDGSGSGSGGPWGTNVTYGWALTDPASGVTVTFDDAASATPVVTIPALATDTELTFTLTVTGRGGTDGIAPATDTATVTAILDGGICGRTLQVRDALVAKISGVSHCADVTATHLAAITGDLRLGSVGITALAVGDFDGLTGLSRLFLAFNALATLGEGVFDGLASLSELYLENNQLTTLDDDVFEPLTALTRLYLQNNQLTTLDDDVFEPLTALTGLYLFNNALATLPDGVFDGLTSLMELSLIYNQLTTLDDDVFQPLTALTTLALRENPGAPFAPEAVALPDDGTVSAAGGMVTLDGSGSDGGPWGTHVTYGWALTDPASGVTVTFDDAASATPEVTIPALATDTGLTFTLTVTGRGGTDGIVPGTDTATVTVDPTAGICGRTLQVRDALVALIPVVSNCADVTATHLVAITGDLRLGSRGITALAVGDFDGLTGLSRLFLAFNALATLGEGVFDGLTSLSELYLQNNQLTTLDDDVFEPLTALTRLYLQNNQLTTLDDDVFEPLTALTGLYLFNNALATLPDGVFDGLTSLMELSLIYNQLTTLDDDVFQPLTALTTLALRENPGAPFAPEAVALPDDGTVSNGGGTVTLDGSGSDGGPWGTHVTYGWALTDPASGVTVTFDDDTSATPVVTIPALATDTELTFTLTVTGRGGTDGIAPATDTATVTAILDGGICGRTLQVRDALVGLMAQSPGVSHCADVTATHLAAITGTLTLNSVGITALAAGDFDGLTSLRRLFLADNALATLGEGVFDGLTSLMELSLIYNQLTTLDDDVFQPLTALTTLALRENPGAPFAPEAVALPDDGTLSNGGGMVTLDGSGSGGPWGTKVTYGWALTDPVSGVTVTFDDATSATPVVTIPAVATDTELTFTLTVTGRGGTDGIAPATDTATVTVDPGICGRTLQVRNGLVALIPGVSHCSHVTATHLAAITGAFRLTNNSIDRLAAGDFDGLTSLSVLGLQGNNLTTLPDGVFEGLTSLINLTLQSNRLTTLPDDVFEPLTSLSTLLLEGNRLTTLDAGMFAGLTGLTRLYLGSNALTTLPDDVFEPLTSLKVLSLDFNNLATLDAGVFDGLTALTDLGLASNQLTTLDDDVFEPLTALTALTLSGNPGAPFAPDAVALPDDGTVPAAGGMVTLDGSGSDGGPWGTNVTYGWALTDPASGVTVTFDDATSATPEVTIPALARDTELTFTLTVTGRGGTDGIAPAPDTATVTVAPGICGRTPQVRDALVALISGVSNCADVTATHLVAITGTLSITRSGITALAARDFDGLTGVTGLAVSFNALTTLPDGVFDELTSLRHLYLQGNQLSTLPDGVFDELTSLTDLVLASNDLTTLRDDVFDGLTALSELSISYNDLTTLPDDVFDGLTALTDLALTDNPGAPFAPEAVALPDDGRVSAVGGMVTLDGSGSGGAWGTNVTYGWALTDPASGVTVTFDDAASATPEVTIPALAEDTELTFTLTVTGRGGTDGIAPASDTATVTAAASNDAKLSALTVNDGTNDLTLAPVFASGTFVYAADVATAVDEVTLSATVNHAGASVSAVTLNGTAVADSDFTDGITVSGLLAGGNDIVVTVTAEDTSTTRTYTVTVTANTAPTALDASVTTNEDTAYTFGAADFNFDDTDTGDALASVTVVTLPAEGSLTLDGPAVTTGQSVPAADIGKLVFTPVANGNGDAYARFTFRVHDGTDESASAYTMTVNVTAMNDPATGAPAISGTAQVGQTLTAATLGIADVDGLTSPTYSYRWIRVDDDGTSNPTDITGATSATYKQLEADVGRKLRVTVSFTDDDGNDEELTSTPTARVMVLDPTVGICGRTPQVRDALVALIPDVSNCADVTATHLAAITGTLSITRSGITALAARDFDGLTGVTGLAVSFNALTSLPDGVFDELTSLRQLYLQGNQLSTLPDGVFDELTSLTDLVLASNDLTTLRDDVFDGLTSLSELSISYNDLTTLPDDVFDGLTSLSKLSISYNDLATLPADVFDGLTALEELYLNENDLATLPADVFDGLTALTDLSLSANDLTTLPDDVFDGLTALTDLALGGNPGAPFAPEAVALPDDGRVSAAEGTVTLDGSGSGGPWGTNVTYGWALTDPVSGVTVTFDDAASATPEVTIPEVVEDTELTFTLTVTGRGGTDGIAPASDTATVTVAPGICGRTEQVRDALVAQISGVSHCADVTASHLAAITGTLSITRSGITALAARDFDGLTGVTGLAVSFNALTTLPDGVFDELTSLRQLYLQGNQLSTLPDGVFDELTSLTDLVLASNDLTTLRDDVFDGLTALSELSISYNDLTTLPDDVFDGLTALTDLALTDNPGAPFAPEAVALPDDGRVSAVGGMVTLDGSGSGGAWGTNVTYGWALTDPASGVTVTFDDAASATPVVTIPALAEDTELTFTLTVTGRGGTDGIAPASDTATVTAAASNDAKLSALTVNDGTNDLTLAPVFASGTFVYAADVATAVDEVTLSATVNHAGASVSAVTLNGTAVADSDFTDGITVSGLLAGGNDIVVTVTAEDTSTTRTYTVTVTANTAPTALDASVTTNEDTAYTFGVADFNFDDTDTGDALASVTVVTLPAEGALELDGTPVTTGESVPAADIGKLVFTPVANGNGDAYARFTFRVHDGTDESASAYTMTVNVTAMNDPATGAPTISGTAVVSQTLPAATTGHCRRGRPHQPQLRLPVDSGGRRRHIEPDRHHRVRPWPPTRWCWRMSARSSG